MEEWLGQRATGGKVLGTCVGGDRGGDRGWGRVPRNQRRPLEKGVPYSDQQENVETSQQREHLRDFPAYPVVETLHSQCRGHRFNPWSRN